MQCIIAFCKRSIYVWYFCVPFHHLLSFKSRKPTTTWL